LTSYLFSVSSISQHKTAQCVWNYQNYTDCGPKFRFLKIKYIKKKGASETEHLILGNHSSLTCSGGDCSLCVL